VYYGVKDTVEKGSVARRNSKSSSSSSSSSASAAQQPFALLSAPFLAQHDVVLTTYDVLRSEVHHAAAAAASSTTGAGSSGQQQSSGRTTRYAKTYKVVPSPLTALRWWRVAIDEAQMVETTTTRKCANSHYIHTVSLCVPERELRSCAEAQIHAELASPCMYAVTAQSKARCNHKAFSHTALCLT
jgi:SNF2-related domain